MSTSSYSYNNIFEPAFPVLPVILQNSRESLRTGSVDALLDTASDGTMVPLRYLQLVNATALHEARMSSHWGEWRVVTMYLVDMIIGNLTLAGVFVVGDEEGDDIILGRNILNKLRLELNGPLQVTRVPEQ